MPTAETYLRHHAFYLQEKKRHEAGTKQNNKFIKNTIEALKKVIEEGDSTGDDVVDFVVVHFESLDPGLIERYRNAKTKLESHAGQPILFFLMEEKRLSTDLSNSRKYIEETRYLGLLGTESLRFGVSEETISIPISKLAAFPERQPTEYSIVENSWIDILVNGYCQSHFITMLAADEGSEETPHSFLDKMFWMIIGDEAVQNWFDENPYHKDLNLYHQVLDELRTNTCSGEQVSI